MANKPVLGSYGYGEQMRAARKARGWTQAQLGERLGISKQYVCDLEYERREPGERVALAISKCLDVQWYTVNHLLRERVAELAKAAREVYHAHLDYYGVVPEPGSPLARLREVLAKDE